MRTERRVVSSWGWALVILSSVLVACFRLSLIDAGPDIDTDAYGHAVIGRTLLANPTDVRQHWVWLPVWQFVYAAVTVAGGGLHVVRCMNVAFSCAAPLVLTALLLRHTRRCPRHETWVAFLSGALLAWMPITLDQGQAGEPEALFALLLLTACWLVEASRAWIAGLVFAAAVLLRYEAWPVLGAFGIGALFRARWRVVVWIREAGVVVIPSVAIALWCWVHYRATGEWLWFVRANREFVAQAHALVAPDAHGPVRSALWYPALLPYITMGTAALFASLGVFWAWRHVPVSLGLSGATLLAFISYAWVREQHLGLDRHFYAVAPLYAVAIAGGVAMLGRVAESMARALSMRRGTAFPRFTRMFVTSSVGSLLVLTLVGRHSLPLLRQLREAHASALAGERVIARSLAQEPGQVVCDVSEVEVLSGLDVTRFERVPPGELDATSLETRGWARVHIVTRAAVHLAGARLRASTGKIHWYTWSRGEPLAERPE